MEDHIKASIITTLTLVLLCFVTVGYGQETDDDFLDYIKRNAKQEYRSAKFDRNAISDFLKKIDQARGRQFFFGEYDILPRYILPRYHCSFTYYCLPSDLTRFFFKILF